MMHAIELLAQATIMAVVALGAWAAMGEGMALSGVARIAGKLPSWLSMPLATCPRCMVSVWGITALIVCGVDLGVSLNLSGHMLRFDEAMNLQPVPPIELNWSRLAQLPVLILAACGLQEMFHRP